MKKKIYWQKYYQINKEKRKREVSVYQKLHPEKHKLWQKRYRESHREEQRIYSRRYYKNYPNRHREYYWNNLEKCRKRAREYARTWRQKNPEKSKAIHKRSYLKNQEKRKECTRIYRLRHKVEISAYNKLYRKKNIEEIKYRERNYRKDKNYRARKRNNLLRWNKSNISHVRAYNNRRYQKEPIYRLKAILRASLTTNLNRYTQAGKVYPSKKYGIDYLPIVKYLLKIAPLRLKKNFQKYKQDYDVDHIIPCNVLDDIKDNDIKKVVPLIYDKHNFQWLPYKTNGYKKSWKIPAYNQLPKPTKQIYNKIVEIGYALSNNANCQTP
jgi:hypothetical protein